MPEPDGLRPATYQDIITAVAKEHKIPPELALAVAQQESNFNPAAKSPKGAVGLFQLMPDTAAELGVTDIADPVQNITGGIKYLRQLSDRYQGDVTKVLHAYNGGMGRVDAGTIPAESQAYAANILANLSQQQRSAVTGPPPGSRELLPSHGPTTPPAPEQRGYLRELGAAFDPREPAGRRNLAAGAGAVAVGALTDGLGVPAYLAWALPAAGAAMGGIGAESLEQAAGTKPMDSDEVRNAGLTSAAYELGGQALMWPIKRAARAVAATKIGRATVDVLGANKRAAQQAGSDLVRTTRQTGADAMAAARGQAAADVASVKDALAQGVERATTVGRRLGKKVKSDWAEWASNVSLKGEQQVAKAAEQSADALAKAELEAAGQVAETAAKVSRIGTPSTVATGNAAREVFAGLPGLQGMGEGPAKRALDIAGQRIEEAAKTGPAVKTGPIKAALDKMAAKARPDTLFSDGGEEATRGIGFLSGAGGGNSRIAAAASAQFKNDPEMLKIIAKQIGADFGLPESHPLPGILAKIQQAPESLSFADAHQLKRLLDEAVNFDKTAKKHLEGLTKGIRTVLREQMRGHAPYDEATAAYGALVPLYRKGVGARLIRAAATDPDKVATILNPKSPRAAMAVRDLLVTQSEAGGDAAAGQRAWDAVRATYTHNKLLKQGADGLTQRLADLEKNAPEFVKVVYGDPTAQQILGNLRQLGAAYDTAVAQQAEKTAAAKVAGKAAVETAKAQAERAATEAAQQADTGVQRGMEALRTGRSAARQVGRAEVAATKEAGRQLTEAQRKTNARNLTSALQQSRAGKEAVREDAVRFGKSSLHKFTSDAAIERELGDLVRAGALGPGTTWGALSAIRLLTKNASKADLLEWAAYSNMRTSLVTKLLLSQLLDRATANVLRDMAVVLNPPMPSHESAAASPEAGR